MRSTGEVMAGGATPEEAYARALRAAGRSRRAGSIGPPLQELDLYEEFAAAATVSSGTSLATAASRGTTRQNSA